jgi:hypothetical protein
MTLLEKIDLNDVHLSIDKSFQTSAKVKINTKKCEKVDTAPLGSVFSMSLKNDESHLTNEPDTLNSLPQMTLSNNIPSLRLENKSLDLLNNTYDVNDFSSKRLYLRCFSEPPSIQFNKNLIHHSPTIRLLFRNMKKQSTPSYNSKKILSLSNQSIANDLKLISKLDSKKFVKFSIEDFFSIFSWKQLAYKRSFSSTKLKIEKKLIKKSPSFKNFLKNVLKGKQKSNSMCNFNGSVKPQENCFLSDYGLKTSRRASTNYSLKEQTNSGGSTNSLDQMMMLILNNTTWPVLKIDDSLRNSRTELEDSQRDEKNQNSMHIDRIQINDRFPSENKSETSNIETPSKISILINSNISSEYDPYFN